MHHPHSPSHNRRALCSVSRRIGRILSALMLMAHAPCVHADAMRLGLGARTIPKPALSIQIIPESTVCAYHIAAHLSEEAAIADADCQRLFWPAMLKAPMLSAGLYAGIGIRGEAARENGGVEQYHLRLPLGLQLDIRPLYLSGFIEVFGLLGPMPKTSTSSAVSAGLRALF